jgi:hypothetical protein
MHPTTTGAKIYQPDRSANTKGSSLPTSSQQAPSRPSSAAPNVKADTDRSKTPLGGEGLNTPEVQGSSSNEALRGLPGQIGSLTLDHFNAMGQATRGHPGANPSQGYMPPAYFNPNMNVGSQPGYAPATPQMQFYANFAPNVYGNAPPVNSARPGSALQRVPTTDAKFPPNQLHSNGPQLANNMGRRQSGYFVGAPMSPVQNTFAPRGWVPNNPTMIGPMAMQNGSGSLPNPAMYQPAMMSANANPPLLTPPGTVQAAYPPAYPPGTIPTNNFGYPTPPDQTQGVMSPEIPPPVPSVYPDPAYSNINNCIYNPKGTTNVYIRGLRPETTDEDLLHMVMQYGNIISTKAIIDTQTKSCKGYVIY